MCPAFVDARTRAAASGESLRGGHLPALAARLAELGRNFDFDQLKQLTAVSRQVTELRRMATHQSSLPAGCVSGEAVSSSNYYIAGMSDLKELSGAGG